MADDFEATVRASGGSLAVTIPKRVAEEMALEPGTRVHVRLFRGVDIRDLRGAWKKYADRLGDYRQHRNRKDYE